MRRSLAVVAICLALALVGCGGESSSDSSTDAPAVAAKPEPPGPTRRKPTLKVPDRPPPTVLVKKDVIEGTGREAKKGDEISMQYVGYLYESGSLFASTSWFAKAPAVITLGDPGLTEGWNRGIEGMRVGGRREVIIPPKFAYGSEAVGAVPANSTLVYLIDLISVE